MCCYSIVSDIMLEDSIVPWAEWIYFLEDKTYIYGYRTVKDEFADNEEEMTVYLESFSMAVGK